MARCVCRCRCGCRRRPGRRVKCSDCGYHVCPGYCLAIEIDGVFRCRKCLILPCDGVPERWQLMGILENQFYVGLICFQKWLNVNADDLRVKLLAQYLCLQRNKLEDQRGPERYQNLYFYFQILSFLIFLNLLFSI